MLQILYDFFSNLTYAVGLSHPLSLVVLYIMGLITDIGVPLLFSLEIFLLFASYYVGPFSIQVLLIVLMLLLGRESGGAVLYWFSYIVGDPFLHWLQRYFPWFIKSANNLKSIIRQKIILMVVAVRLTPGFLQVPAILTGSLRLSYPRFALGVMISSLIYDSGLVIFGFVASLFLKNARQDLQTYFVVFFIAFIIIIWLGLFFRFRNIFNRRNRKG